MASSIDPSDSMSGAVTPLSSCPHLSYVVSEPTEDQNVRINAQAPCSVCGDTRENWLCLTCLDVYCSRFVQGHALKHTEQTKHPMALSFSDMSVWCYECDSYVNNPVLNKIRTIAYDSKQLEA